MPLRSRNDRRGSVPYSAEVNGRADPSFRAELPLEVPGEARSPELRGERGRDLWGTGTRPVGNGGDRPLQVKMKTGCALMKTACGLMKTSANAD